MKPTEDNVDLEALGFIMRVVSMMKSAPGVPVSWSAVLGAKRYAAHAKEIETMWRDGAFGLMERLGYPVANRSITLDDANHFIHFWLRPPVPPVA